MIVTGGSGVLVKGHYEGLHGRALTRRELDAALASAAAAAGAGMEERVLVQGPLMDSSCATPFVAGLVIQGRAGGTIRVPASIVIAADGRYSRVARGLGLSRSAPRPRRWAIGGYFQDVEGMTSFGEMHVRPRHYIGVAPLPGGLANACLVTPRPSGRSMNELLLATLRSDPLLRDRFAHARMIGDAICLGPLAVDCDRAGMPGLLLAGDAAGFVDPMTGDGLRFAFRGGELAALEALRALEYGEQGAADAHVRLHEARRREFTRKVRFNRRLRSLVASPAAVHAAAYGAAVAPAVLQRVIRYAGDPHAA
jgi:flavin-dependent dehydrogenase